jgi:hypothetical protein
VIELTDQLRRYAEAVNPPGAIGPDPAETAVAGPDENQLPLLAVPAMRPAASPARDGGGTGGRRLWWLVAASVIIAVGAVSWIRENNDHAETLSAGAAAYLIPPADASDVAVYAVPGGETVTYRNRNGQYMSIDNLSQISGGVEVSTGEQTWITPVAEFASEATDPGTRQFTVEGLGQVNVRCATSDANGPEADAVRSYFGPLQASMVIGNTLVSFRESSPVGGPVTSSQAMTEWQEQPCSPPSAAPLIIGQLSGLRATDEAGWASFIADVAHSAETGPVG